MFIPNPGSRIWIFSIPDPRSWIKIFSILDPWSQIWIFSIPDPGSASKNLSILTKKMVSHLMIRVCHPRSGSRIWILTFYLSWILLLDPRSQIQGSKRHRIPDPGSGFATSGDFRFAQAVGGSVGYWLSTGAAVITTHPMDQFWEAFRCKKEFSVYFIKTLSL